MLYKLLALSSLVASTIGTELSSTLLPNEARDPWAPNPKVIGQLQIDSDSNGWGSGRPQIRIIGQISGLKPRQRHGFHIHEYGNIYGALPTQTIDCALTGGHYNPYDQKHGGLTGRNRHIGDLGNIEADRNGVAKVDIRADIDLNKDGIIGRAFVVHEGRDDLRTDPTGASGERLACGAITIAKPKPEPLKSVEIGCFNYANRGDYFVPKNANTNEKCEQSCAENDSQFYGIDGSKNCACFKSFGKAIKNDRRVNRDCKNGVKNIYTLYFNPDIHAQRNNGWIISEKFDKCAETDRKGAVKLFKCDKAEVEQRWIETDDGHIINYKNGLCLDAGTRFNTLSVKPCEPRNRQEWILDNDGIYTKQNGNGKNLLCVDAHSSTNVELEKCDWSRSQRFDASGIQQQW